jgi:mannose-1-phosphate guanylyltransferase / mannose-6-phosphate isomerase
MKLVILAGWGGSRLRPLSQWNTPKQFIALDGKLTMLEKTIQRILPLVADPGDICISTSVLLEEQVRSYAKPFGITHIIAEPMRRNTAPAFWLVLRYLKDLALSNHESVIFFPADHEIAPEELFRQYIHVAAEACKQASMILFGIKPTTPETGYGYLKLKDNFLGSMLAEVEQFVEKPTLEKAITYMQSGGYFWNAGIFAASFQTFWQAFEEHAPEIFHTMQQSYADMLADYGQLPDISIDYAIMEKLTDIKLIPMFLNRSDMGSRDAVYEFFPKDLDGNVAQWSRDLLAVKNCLLLNMTDTPCKIAYIENSIMIITDHGQYITKRGMSQEIKKML